jgi:tetratricopeptide (TPR) repeat protein
VLLTLWRKRDSWGRPWFFVYAFFLVALLPGLGLADNAIFTHSLVFDHFQYLASMGPLALAGAGIVRLRDFPIPGRSWLSPALGAGVLLILAILSWLQVWVYQNQETLWRDTLARNPNFELGHNNLGIALRQRGQVDEAITEYQKAVALDPYYVDAHYNLGIALSLEGRLDEAVAEYQKAIKIDPGNALVHNNLAITFAQKGRLDEAIAEYQKALAINPDYAEGHNNLGMALLQKGQVAESMAQFQEALRLKPDLAIAQQNLAKAQAAAGRIPGSK